MVTPPTIT
jgi:diphosphate--fructose-6-phosphate 1-phosphotransferase